MIHATVSRHNDLVLVVLLTTLLVGYCDSNDAVLSTNFASKAFIQCAQCRWNLVFLVVVIVEVFVLVHDTTLTLPIWESFQR
jgi:hypothetical protein